MAPPIRPIADRIKERVTISDRGCWLWNGPIFKDGYGAIGIKRTGQHRAHRVSFATFVSPIPAGMWVLHRCDTPSCVNPEHLFLGSARDNALDREAKGRANRAHGASHHWAKHTAVCMGGSETSQVWRFCTAACRPLQRAVRVDASTMQGQGLEGYR